MQLFLLIGQSNMAGRGGVEVQDQVSNPRIYMLNGILQNLPKTVPQCAVVSSRGLTDKGDHLHFDAGALRTFGKRYAEAFIALKSGESKP